MRYTIIFIILVPIITSTTTATIIIVVVVMIIIIVVIIIIIIIIIISIIIHPAKRQDMEDMMEAAAELQMAITAVKDIYTNPLATFPQFEEAVEDLGEAAGDAGEDLMCPVCVGADKGILDEPDAKFVMFVSVN
nr:hypothetical protein BaRGS_030920 [Batillaria attramentaria]